jgi:hypothetical protein
MAGCAHDYLAAALSADAAEHDHGVKRTNKLQKESGVTSFTLPMMNQGEVDCREGIKKMTTEEIEKALYRQARRPADRIRGEGVPKTARALMEDNKQLVLEKQERKALARQNSREFVERLLADDRVVNEADKAKDIGRRAAQRGLAQYYKAKIAEKETEKSNAYQNKLDKGADIQYFPFIEGETIGQNRQAEAAKMRQDMRNFLQKQQLEKPPKKTDNLMMDSDQEYQHRYPFMPVYNLSARRPQPPEEPLPTAPRAPASARGASASARGASASATPREGGAQGEDGAPHLAKYPRFLSKAQNHMSRRIHDIHVRKALEDKVARTKAELEELTRRRELEAQQWEDGLMVNDALRYDGSRLKAVERQSNASYLQKQIQERKDQRQEEKQARRAEPAGYWGPDEKELRDSRSLKTHFSDLINQMEVNQIRKLDSRNKRLQQEKNVVDNSLVEMSQDREKERDKMSQHKEILTMTWESQKKIKEVMNRIDTL